MLKHILVPLDGSPLDERALAAAFDLGRLFAGHVEALFAQPDPRQDLHIVGEGFDPGMLDTLMREAERSAREVADKARQAFDQAVRVAAADLADAPHDGERVTAWWRPSVGRAAQAVAEEGRFADLLLFAQAPEASSRRTVLEAALFDTGRPLLLASDGMVSAGLSSVAVAWNGSLPAVRAVTAAMPFLRRADTVTILTVEEGAFTHGLVPAHATRLVEHLAWHGIAASVQALRRQDLSVGERLATKAVDLGAGLLVMGGYGHSRFREVILGGATRHLLGTPVGCSVLMVH